MKVKTDLLNQVVFEWLIFCFHENMYVKLGLNTFNAFHISMFLGQWDCVQQNLDFWVPFGFKKHWITPWLLLHLQLISLFIVCWKFLYLLGQKRSMYICDWKEKMAHYMFCLKLLQFDRRGRTWSTRQFLDGIKKNHRFSFVVVFLFLSIFDVYKYVSQENLTSFSLLVTVNRWSW